MRERQEILEALYEADTTERAADIAVDFVMHVLAEAVGVSAWTPSDGSETWDGDVAGTVYSILRAARVLDEDTDETAMICAEKAEAERDAARARLEEMRATSLAFQMERDAARAEVERLTERVAWLEEIREGAGRALCEADGIAPDELIADGGHVAWELHVYQRAHAALAAKENDQ